MILYFLMKKLVTDTSGEEIRRVTEILKGQKIKHVVRTVRARGSIGTAMDSRTYARANLAMYKGASMPNYVYMVYVNRGDFENARDLVYGD